MPRRSNRLSGGGAGAGLGKQSTLSFNHRVTKSVPKSVKDAAGDATIKTKDETEIPVKTEDVLAEDISDIPVKDEAKVKVEKEEEVEEKVVLKEEEEKQEVEDKETKDEVKEEVKQKSDAEVLAGKMSSRDIERYWREIEASRMAKEVHRKHTKGLTTGEKVLRYFDVSSHYGPCTGITRLKRWQRAERLGLNPPIEVLAVLLQGEATGNKGIQRAHMDELLSSTTAGSV